MLSLQISSVKGDFKLEAEVTKDDRKELLTVHNPKFNEMIRRYAHLQCVVMEDTDDRDELPVHVILGASGKLGRIGEPVADKTRFGWTIMSWNRPLKRSTEKGEATRSNNSEQSWEKAAW